MKPKIAIRFVLVVAAFNFVHPFEDDIRTLVTKISKDHHLSVPCNCGLSAISRAKSSSIPHTTFPRAPAISEAERRQRINESMARFMQVLTFFGHVDNFLTQKTHGLIKMMGKAIDEVDGNENRYHTRDVRIMRRQPPIIPTNST